MDVIIMAKERQAVEANKNASILLQELDQERVRKTERERENERVTDRLTKRRRDTERKTGRETEREWVANISFLLTATRGESESCCRS